MENKYAGWLVVGISVIMAVFVGIFNYTLKNLVGETCTHGATCSMYDTIAIQTWISLAVVAVILVIGIVIMFTKPKERIIIRTKKQQIKKIDKSKLDSKEKQVVEILERENGAIFQKTLMEELGIGKVGITRLLDKLEAKQILERKRRGMNNIVVLKRD